MKNQIKKITLSSAIFAISMLAITPALAQENLYPGPVTMKQLGTPAILNTNLFYGSKNLFTDIKGTLISNPLAKLQFYFQVANGKASEILMLTQVAPDNQAAITKALAEYQRSVIHIGPALGRFLDSDSPSLAWQSLARAHLLHLEFVDGLLAASTSNVAKGVLIDVHETLTHNLVRLLVGTGRTDTFVEALAQESAQADLGLANLPVAERLRDLAQNAAYMGESEAAASLMQGNQLLLERVAVVLWERFADGDSEVITDLKRIPGNAETRAVSLKQIMAIQPALSGNKELQALQQALQ